MKRQIISYISYHKLFLQCCQCFISALYVNVADVSVFTKAMDIGGNFEALSFQLALWESGSEPAISLFAWSPATIMIGIRVTWV